MLKNSLIELRQLPKNKQKMLPEQKKKCTYLCTLYNSMQYMSFLQLHTLHVFMYFVYLWLLADAFKEGINL